jgi:ABC-type transport system involved in cytochrome c biogenesis permease component
MSITQSVQKLSVNKIKVSEKASPVWWLVFRRELTDLWIGGKAFNLVLIYSLLLGGMVYVYSFNTELSLIPPKEATYEMLKNAMAVAMFVGLIIGADAFSGERDRATLESLLLTPANRRQIIMGKFLAAFSIWPAAYVIAIPYLYVLAQGDSVLAPALFWGAVTGTILVVGYTAVGMLVSFWSSTNKVSYFIALGIYAALLIPAELPGTSSGAAGQFLQWVNPMAAVNHFLSKHLVNYRTFAEFGSWLITAVVLAVVSMAVLMSVGAGLRLEPGRRSKLLARVGRAFGISVIIGVMMLSLLIVSPAYATPAERPQVVMTEGLTIAIDVESKHVKTGDSVEFSTTITNTAAEASPPLIVAMNVINLDATGDVVDPEDWSPQRTQYIDSIGAGESATQNWIINTILEGDFMVYMVLIPEPESAEATSHPVSSPGIHLTVDPFTRLNPGGVLPFAIGGPIILLVITYFVYRRRRQQIDMGGSS